VTRLTLRTHDLPAFLGAVFATIKANSDAAYRRLIGKVIEFYAGALFNPHWGEQIGFRPGRILSIAMTFQGLDQQQAEALWRPFFGWVADSPQDFSMLAEPAVLAAPARTFWDPGFLKQVPGLVLADDRARAPAANVFWASNLEEAGQVMHGYQSAWIPASLLRGERQEALADALLAAAEHWHVTLHVNKGLAGGRAEVIEAARDTAMNPAVLDAFALLISGAQGPPAYPGIRHREPDQPVARRRADAIEKAMRAPP
jgi:hypothetical protein